jgi:hypothetical protein
MFCAARIKSHKPSGSTFTLFLRIVSLPTPLPEAIGAPFGGMVTANCEFCLREQECHAVAEHDVQLRSTAEGLPASLTLDREIPTDRGIIAGRALDLRGNLLRLGLAKK